MYIYIYICIYIYIYIYIYIQTYTCVIYMLCKFSVLLPFFNSLKCTFL